MPRGRPKKDGVNFHTLLPRYLKEEIDKEAAAQNIGQAEVIERWYKNTQHLRRIVRSALQDDPWSPDA